MKQWFATAGLLACGPAVAAKAPAPEQPVETRNLTASPGVTLVQACTPTGPELCFNAIDDNCNGVIDEGCGVQTGLMQFTIAWSSEADVNLAVAIPGEEKALDQRNRATKGGFHLDRDCPEEECKGQNEENVFFDGLEAPPTGHYVVTVSVKDLKGAEPPVKVRFGARLGTRVVGFDMDLSAGQDPKTLSFDVP